MIDSLIKSFQEPIEFSADERRGVIARYSAVLEGNFIYWMTAAYLAVNTEEARAIIRENLLEEVRDCHPAMLRKFTVAANAVPTQTDTLRVAQDLMAVRLFLGRLQAPQIVLMMAFFEGFIQRFMSPLAELAKLQGSEEFVYTNVHGICDVEHYQGLFDALDAEMAANPVGPDTNLFEGVELLRRLIETMVHRPTALAASGAVI